MDALTRRVAWMIEQGDDPEREMAVLAYEMEKSGVWNGPNWFERADEAAQAMMRDNLMFPDLFNLVVQLPNQEPFSVRRMTAAEEAIRGNQRGGVDDVRAAGDQ